MKNIKEIQKEIKRCEIERDECVKGGSIIGIGTYNMYNDRLWALKWVLEEKE